MVRLKDIAEELNITVNSVSKALRGMKGTSLELQKKVQETARRMKYVPNSAAQCLRTNSTKILAVLFDNLLNPYYSIMLDLLVKNLQKHGYTCILFSIVSSKLPIVNEETMLKVISRNVDGIISFIDVDENSKILLEKYRLPVFLFSRKPANESLNYFSCDDVSGGYIATKHLIELGHKKIAFLGYIDNLQIAHDRLNGYKKALEEAGIPYDLDLVSQRTEKFFTGSAMIENLLSRRRDFSAFVSFNDYFAYDAIAKLFECGYTVPGDFSVVGYDNLGSHVANPIPLTSVGYDKQSFVLEFIESVLKKLVDAEAPNFSKTIEPTLYLGKTTRQL